jgi:hypothetical protein
MRNFPRAAELDHVLGSSMLGEAMLQWKPQSPAAQQAFVQEILTQSRALTNALSNILEHRAVSIDQGSVVGTDIVDAWDLYGLADLLGSLLDVVAITTRDSCREERP